MLCLCAPHALLAWSNCASWILISAVFAKFLNQTLIDRKKCFCFESYFRKKFLKHFANVYDDDDDDAEREALFPVVGRVSSNPSNVSSLGCHNVSSLGRHNVSSLGQHNVSSLGRHS